MQGKAVHINDEKENKEILQMFNKKFPFTQYLKLDEESVIIKITPTIGYFSDYNKRFGHLDKVEY
jgi:hypothetical protein